MSRSFSKIKIKESGCEVHFIEHTETTEGEVKNRVHQIKSDVKPHLEFFNAFQEMKRYAVAYMELTPFKSNIEEHILANYVVTTVSITEDTDTVKLQISINKTLSNGKVFSVTTPLIDIEDEEFVERENLERAYELLLDEALEYLDGKNGDSQLKIEFKAA